MSKTLSSRNRSYTEDELRARVSVLEPGVVMVREIPEATADTFRFEMEVARELGRAFSEYVLIIDLAEATRPRPDVIEEIIEGNRDVGVQWCVVQNTSRIMAAVTRFVLSKLAGSRIKTKTTVHTSLDDALNEARGVLGARPSGDGAVPTSH
ncbi:MAG: hypothetical protein KC731_42440 [Myxococcales bacterium]|nr:hypothetical protein [Myxococcales bacterium]